MKTITLILICASGLVAGTPAKVCEVDAVSGAVNEARCFLVPGDVMDSFDLFIAAQNAGVPEGEPPQYANTWDLIVKHFLRSLVLPTLDQYPVGDYATAKANAQQAAAAADAAKAAIEQALEQQAR